MKAIVTVVGQDREGIIAPICARLAEYKVNVLDISQTILQGYFTMIMVVDISACTPDFAQLVNTLEEDGRARDLTIHVQREDIFNAMHRI